tara:strand:+ start:26474 stop:27025 length:552 start_codon:yes stop_codon:yes gene_type:complete
MTLAEAQAALDAANAIQLPKNRTRAHASKRKREAIAAAQAAYDKISSAPPPVTASAQQADEASGTGNSNMYRPDVPVDPYIQSSDINADIQRATDTVGGYMRPAQRFTNATGFMENDDGTTTPTGHAAISQDMASINPRELNLARPDLQHTNPLQQQRANAAPTATGITPAPSRALSGALRNG